jgi:hypothetical protein
VNAGIARSRKGGPLLPSAGECRHRALEETADTDGVLAQDRLGAPHDLWWAAQARESIRLGVVADVLALEPGGKAAAEELEVRRGGQLDRRPREAHDPAALQRIGPDLARVVLSGLEQHGRLKLPPVRAPR